ncbi:hypothetical protein APR11_001988 [Nocardia amikacinitolerans]|uniref:DUF7373 family lipoprotein n=1 Tax=Nocardia amikacinitolerans TaxID=756689 RepID=UPI0020A575E8|nr:hypothetical protein [Nocardia amikacinitolerans]MCP2295570.1 hypothetical protein [Nocardia amikacinitolerans]
MLCVLAIALGTSAGCGSDQRPATAPKYDISQLDSGNYPTTPRDPERARTDKSGHFLEAARIGAAMPLAADVDGKFAYKISIYIDRRLTPNFVPPDTYEPNTSDEFNSLAPGFVAGWHTHGQRRQSVGRELDMQALRFETANHARSALDRIADKLDEAAPGERVSIPGFPDARAKWSLNERRLEALLAQETMVLVVRIDDPVSEPPDPAPLAEIGQRAFTKMLEGLKSYTPTPLAQLGTLPMDIDGMLRRTLPLGDKSQFTADTDPSVVHTKQAWLHSTHYPNLSKSAYADAGVDLIGMSGAILYRTRDAASGERLIAALIGQESNKYKAIDSPPNMPGVQCFDRADPESYSSRYPAHCYVAYDRYVAEVSGDNPQDAHQRVAAQYKILASAG